MQIAFTDPTKQEKAYDLKGLRILIIEDYPFIAELMQSLLHEMGVGDVVVAPSISVAKEKIAESNATASAAAIDAVILDWLMPDGTGLELLQWVRSHDSESIRFLPVIVCSAHASQDMVSQSRDAGAHEVMVKPVSADKLAKRLVHVIDKPRPFLKTSDFFGPDRRRRDIDFRGDEKRKAQAETIKVNYERP
ncbi:MAG TPA: response regulator [Patescibacteria group bacterium]|nr:response regulator [Patescibacteria group bacterium]